MLCKSIYGVSVRFKLHYGSMPLFHTGAADFLSDFMEVSHNTGQPMYSSFASIITKLNAWLMQVKVNTESRNNHQGKFSYFCIGYLRLTMGSN